MVVAPFAFVLICIITDFCFLCEDVAGFFFDLSDASFDLPQDHLGNIACRFAEAGDRFEGVELCNALKVAFRQKHIRIEAEAFQHHIRNRRCQLHLKSRIEVLLFCQRTVFDLAFQCFQIIPVVIRDSVQGCAEHRCRKIAQSAEIAEIVLQLLGDACVHLRRRLPQLQRNVPPGVGIRYIEHIP